MASHVEVIDSSMRRAKVKVTPGTYLSDVLQESCRKLGYNADNFSLKHKNKQLDLSITFRLSGLASGAKLELVQLSKSVGVVSVALQMPQTGTESTPNVRLTDKFPSNTTLWKLLRKFEESEDVTASKRNFTARGVPSSTSGSGRLFYEQPVLNVLNRELSSFTDLQKTLAQLGLNTGSALIRMSFRPTQQPLEDAVQEIQAYFDSVEDGPTKQPTKTPVAAQSDSTTDQPADSIGAGAQPPDTEMTGTEPSEALVNNPETSNESDKAVPTAENTTSESQEPLTTTTSRPISVYKPPTGSAPSAALTQDNESDFTPTIEHAQAHQKMLNEAGRNRRLKTDAELAADAKEEGERLAAIKEVSIKIRFPDQSSVVLKVTQAETGSSLYTRVRDECLDPQFKNESFHLGTAGGGAAGAGRSNMVVYPDSDQLLIKNRYIKGPTTVTFFWDDKSASQAARASRTVLKPELQAIAQDIKRPEAPKNNAPEEKGTVVNLGKDDKDDKGEGAGGGIGKKMPKWLKGLNKK